MGSTASDVLVLALLLAVEAVPLGISIWKGRENVAKLLVQVMGLTAIGGFAFFAADAIPAERTTALYVILGALGGALGARVPDGFRRAGRDDHHDSLGADDHPKALPPPTPPIRPVGKVVEGVEVESRKGG